MPTGPAVEDEDVTVTFDIDQKSVTHVSVTCLVPASVARKGDEAVKRWLKRNDWKDEEHQTVGTDYGAYDHKSIQITYNGGEP